MSDILAGDERVVLVEPRDDVLVAGDGILASPGATALHERAIVIDGHDDGYVELEADLVVIGAMAGSGVNRTGTRIQRDMITVGRGCPSCQHEWDACM